VAELPSGTVTFLFTDLQGSTRLWESDREAMAAAVARHHELLNEAVHSHGGVVFSYMGDGVAAAFGTAPDAVAAAVDAQRALASEDWGSVGPLRARMGVHTGEGRVVGDQYESHTLNRCARLMGVAHGGQLVISGSTAELVRGELPVGVELVDLGEHRLRDLRASMHVFQVGAPGLASTFPPLRSTDSLPRSLPAQLDRFVGRVHELRDIVERLGSTRLLTLFGPGGTGKTRLAVQAANALRNDFADRVCFVDLSACRDVESVLSVTARSIGAREQETGPLLDAVKERIGSQAMLLVFDNFEQVTEAALAVSELLRDCPELKLLVTSREALNVSGEQVYPVPPLALPGVEVGYGSVAVLAESEAVQLFVERARAIRPDFELTAENAAAVRDLCIRLDGLPLAIELATARLALLSPQALVERLGDRLNLLTGGARDAPERQRTLRDTILWSYELLTGAEQRLLALLAVFSGMTLEAVEAVAGRVEGLDGIDVLDALGSLVDKSLLRRVDATVTGPRLSMLESIRSFAAEQLGDDPDLRDRARRAHAEYFADWTLHHCEKLTGDERDAASERMAADIGNLGAAWRYWVAEEDFEELGKLTDGLWLLYNVRGWHHEAATLITDLLDVLSSTPENEERLLQQVLLQTSLARVLLASEGYTRETERAYQRALELCEAQGGFPQLLPVLRGLSTFYIYLADFEKSVRIGEQLLALAERFDDTRARVEGHVVIGASEGMLAHFQPAIDYLERGIAAYDAAPRKVERFEAGNDPGVVCHVVEGMLLWMKGSPDRARERAYAALELAERLHHPQSSAYAHFHTGLIHMWLREAERAAEHADVVIDIAAAHEFPVWTAAASCLQGAAMAATGFVDEGLARLEAAMHQYRALKSPPVFWPSLLQFHAEVLGRAGRPRESVARVDEALRVVAVLPEPQTLSSELLLLKGSLLLGHSNDPDAAEVWFVQAVERADRLEAAMLQLRATTALARLWGAQGKTESAASLLSAAYERFTEGFTTADLTDARRLLDELATTR
jgi:predicted ATPase/class 3 adenylate cyclase